ncbi:hypothetical protein HUK65_10025 [Rhodobacteraceae bacterium 2376]|uniref:HTH DNA binding domain-containing protein n=1 Tax=Rhabdonatronobacter sediminivivens TaxID=2743469 RepID=A0A7Z0HZT5_9RHOB|nr:hypothetical protein [Rhabdonatronobacter sediminivivens]NYS25329.1 hypothetical protein [Rhabdonatronobacter sediminivivens]
MARNPTDWNADFAPQDEADLWFLPAPPEDDPGPLPPLPRAPRTDPAHPEDWAQAEAAQAAALARVAARLGALDDRLHQGPEGWRHRLALLEAADLSWFSGDRVAPDRLALWVGLRLAGVQTDAAALARVGWAVRRLSGGPGPDMDSETALAGFLGRHDPDTPGPEVAPDSLRTRSAAWLEALRTAEALHPITRACMGYHLWALAGLGQPGDRLEAAVTAARLAATAGLHGGAGAVFAPLALGGARGLRASGAPAARLEAWLSGMEAATLAALRALDQVAEWSARAQRVMAPLSGRTPPALARVLAEWPLVSAPMAEALTGASRAAVQRNLAWMEARGLITEVTGQGRFRMWRAALQRQR